jgi:hypothetical protein
MLNCWCGQTTDQSHNRVEGVDSRLGLRKFEASGGATTSSVRSLDLIFVHGLGGNALTTWVHRKSKQFWPQWIPESDQELKDTNIYTFGYDAHWTKLWGPKNVLGVHGFANQLLEDLSGHYQRNGDVPTLSIC